MTTPHHLLTILAVSNLARSVTLYESAFGWPRRVNVPVFVEFALPDGRGLGLYERESFGLNTGTAPAPLPPGAISGVEIYIHCEDPVEVGARLIAGGARELSPFSPRSWGDEAAYYADPDGYVLVVARPL